MKTIETREQWNKVAKNASVVTKEQVIFKYLPEDVQALLDISEYVIGLIKGKSRWEALVVSPELLKERNREEEDHIASEIEKIKDYLGIEPEKPVV